MLYLGLMSGTSLDGLDLALCSFHEDESGRSYQLLKSQWFPYPKDWETLLREASQLGGLNLSQLDRDYGRYLGEQVRQFLEGEDVSEGVLIGSHGHTVFHTPQSCLTLQIGHGPSLRAAAGWPVVYDFRSADVALGGQGAPLVPIFDRDFLAGYAACLNLGGFANVTLLHGETITAFDISPCNTILNDLTNQVDLAYDLGGNLARSGTVIPALLAELNALPFYSLTPPKSLGREFIQEEVQPLLDGYYQHLIPNLLATCTEHIAWAVGLALKDIRSGKVLATGGGAYNDFLIERLQTHCSGLEIECGDASFISFKEAIAIAYLAYLHHKGKSGNLPEVTGALTSAILGTYCP